jgi:glycine cleavage system H protein
MNFPNDLKYTKTHEWIRKEGDKIVVGLTEHAQKELSDIVFVELPLAGQTVEQAKACTVVESVKAASDVYAPVSGTVANANEKLQNDPSLINKDPYGEGWLFEIEPSKPEEIEGLLDSAGYQNLIHQEAK